MANELMIEAEGLTKRYGETQALAGVDFAVPAGTILGVLGPNGAGKTTAVRILTTLATADSGRGRVAGHDVMTEAAEVRRHIGVAAQDATLDELLTGRQNLVLIGQLSRMGRAASQARATELLEHFDRTAGGSEGTRPLDRSHWSLCRCALGRPGGRGRQGGATRDR